MNNKKKKPLVLAHWTGAWTPLWPSRREQPCYDCGGKGNVFGNSAGSPIDREVGFWDGPNAFCANVLNVHVRFKLTAMRLHKGWTKPFEVGASKKESSFLFLQGLT